MPNCAPSEPSSPQCESPSSSRPLWAPWRIDYIRGERPDIKCEFCHAAASEDDQQALVLARGSSCFVIMNRYPYTSGHLMVCPNRHLHDFNELTTSELTEIMSYTQKAIATLRTCMTPQGFNVGFNLGEAAGAGIADHIHLHIVPRWSGDTNFMPVLAHTRVMPEALDQTWKLLVQNWS